MSVYLNNAAEKAAVLALGNDIGFGRIIQLAHQCWDEMLEAKHGIRGHSESWALASADIIRAHRAAAASPAERSDPLRETDQSNPSLGTGGEAWRPTHRHIARGSEYELLGWGHVQCSRSGLLDDEHVAIYRGIDGDLWARRYAEFVDGRFEPIPAAPPPVPTIPGGGEGYQGVMASRTDSADAPAFGAATDAHNHSEGEDR